MKRVALLSAALLLSVTASFGSGVLVEAESFRDKGGWAVDQQFMDQMGSPYLIAHGMGKPVADAVTTVEFPETGTLPGLRLDVQLGRPLVRRGRSRKVRPPGRQPETVRDARLHGQRVDVASAPERSPSGKVRSAFR